jgi:uncharacterized protein (TIGR03000 family)
MRRTLFIIAVLAVLCLAGTSQAQLRTVARPGVSPRLPNPFPPGPRPYPWWWYRPYPVYYPYYVPSYAPYVPPPNPYDYPSPAPTKPTAEEKTGIEVSGPLTTPPPHTAVIDLRVPTTWAKVSFNGQKIDSVGTRRTFVTPELSGPTTYVLAATWSVSGRTVTLKQHVQVEPGQMRNIDFTYPAH